MFPFVRLFLEFSNVTATSCILMSVTSAVSCFFYACVVVSLVISFLGVFFQCVLKCPDSCFSITDITGVGETATTMISTTSRAPLLGRLHGGSEPVQATD